MPPMKSAANSVMNVFPPRRRHWTGCASIAVVTLLPAGVAVTGGPGWEVAASVGLCALVMARHLGNLRRLASRTEPELSSPT